MESKSYLDILKEEGPRQGLESTNYQDDSIEEIVQNYSPRIENPTLSVESYFNHEMEKDFKRINLSPDFMKRVDSESKEMAKNNHNIEQKIKAELSGINIFKKGGHLLKTIISKDYRKQSADTMIDSQLRKSANFRDSIKTIYSNMRSNLDRNSRNLNELERAYFQNVSQREETKKSIVKTKEDYEFLRNASRKGISTIQKEKLEISVINANASNRRAISRLDELNHGIVNNILEREFCYTSGLIFERYESAFKKIYDTSESELRKMETVKGLYLDAMRGGRIVQDLEKSFENVFSSLRLMDNVLSGGIISLLKSSSNTKGRMNDLRNEKRQNSENLLETLKENFIPNAQHLNSLVENYVGSERK